MRSFKIFIGISALILSGQSAAEQGGVPAQSPGQPQQQIQPNYPKPIGSNPNFDDNFFNTIKKSEVVKPSPGSGGSRYVGDEPDYNTQQRSEWLETCAPQKEVSMTAYRECYNREKRNSQDRIRVRFKAVEDRLSGGPGSAAPGGGGNIGLPTVDGPSREPSSGVDR